MLHGRPDKILTNVPQSFRNAHVAASMGVVKLNEDSRDGLEILREPYTTFVKDEVVSYGVLRVLGGVGLNLISKIDEGKIAKELLFKFLQKEGIGNC